MALTTEQKIAIEKQVNNLSETGRATVPGIEKHLYKPCEILDHGFIRVIDYMGDDNAIVLSLIHI